MQNRVGTWVKLLLQPLPGIPEILFSSSTNVIKSHCLLSFSPGSAHVLQHPLASRSMGTGVFQCVTHRLGFHHWLIWMQWQRNKKGELDEIISHRVINIWNKLLQRTIQRFKKHLDLLLEAVDERVEWEAAGGWNESTLTKHSVKAPTSYWNGTSCIFISSTSYYTSLF